MMATKGCEQLSSNDTYFVDIWLSGEETAEEATAEGVDFCCTVNTIHKVFCISTLYKLMRYWP